MILPKAWLSVVTRLHQLSDVVADFLEVVDLLWRAAKSGWRLFNLFGHWFHSDQR
jgi:hypothetical protein